MAGARGMVKIMDVPAATGPGMAPVLGVGYEGGFAVYDIHPMQFL